MAFADKTTNLVNQNFQHQMTGSIGVIMSYDRFKNTCTVAVTESDTDEVREILKNVPCPIQYGIQTVAPEPGKLCWVVFKNGNITSPLIVSYFNHRYDMFDQQRQTRTKFTIPSYLMD